MSTAAMPFPLPDARPAAMLAEDAPDAVPLLDAAVAAAPGGT